MQSSVPDLMDSMNEPAEALDLYGCKSGDGSFASNCLLARRLPSAAYGSFSSITAVGIITMVSWITCKTTASCPWTVPLPDCSPISSAKACLKTP